MRTAIRKHLGDFVAILVLLVIALAISGYIMGKQRLSLPGWVPLVGKSWFTMSAEMSTAQAVTPGQGQTVNIAGVQIGEIYSVRLKDGKAIIGLRVKPEYAKLIHSDASVLLRPKTGLKDMVAELTPGSRRAPLMKKGGVIPISRTLPDVNLDEILAALDSDTRDYLRLLLSDAAQGIGGDRQGHDLANTIRRIEPTAIYSRRVNAALAKRRENIKRVVHNFSLLVDELGKRDTQLANFVENSNAVFSSLARQDASIRATLAQLPSALSVTDSTLAKVRRMSDVLGPTLQALRPGARALGPALAATRPFLRTTTPIIRDELRPFARASLPTVRQLRPAMRDLSAATPDLTRAFKVVNALLNTLAYNPPGPTEEGYLFWLSWANHLGNIVFDTQDAHGPIRRGLIVFSCQTAQILRAVSESNPLLGTLTRLLNGPGQPGSPTCPSSSQAQRGGG